MRTWNAPACKQLSPYGKTVGILFLVLSASLVAAGLGWFGPALRMATRRGHHSNPSFRRFDQHFHGSFP
jgi:hypothetical protein